MKWTAGNQSYELMLDENQKVIPHEMIDTIETAASIIEKASKEAREIIAAARIEADLMLKDAENRGFQEGIKQSAPFADHLREQIATLKMDIQRVALPIALKAAKKIVGEELKLDSGRIVDILLEAIKPIAQCKQIKIIVNPQDLAELEKAKPRLNAALHHADIITLEPRASLESGSAIIESEKGIMNASLNHLWSSLESLFESFI